MQLVGDGVADVGPDEAEGDRPRRGDRALRRRAGAGPRRAGAGRRHLRQRAGRAGHRRQDRGPAAAGVRLAGGPAGQRSTRSSSPSAARTCSTHAEQARLSRRLVALCDAAPLPLPLDELRRAPFDYAGLLEFAPPARLQLAAPSGSSRWPRARADAPRRRGEPAPRRRLRHGATISRARRAGSGARPRGPARARHCRPPRRHRARRAGRRLRSRSSEGEGVYLPLGHMSTSSARAPPASCPASAVLERLRPVLADPAVLKIGHNIKYDAGVLARYGLDVAPYDDTMLLSYVLDGAATATAWTSWRSAPRPRRITYEAVCGSGRKPDRLRPGAGREGHRLRRRGRRGDAAAARPAQAAAARGAPHAGLRDARPAAGADRSPRWSGTASRSTAAAARALGRVRPAHGRARGARPTGSPGARSTSARPSSWARCCSTSRASAGRAQDQDRQPRHRRERARGARCAGPRAAARRSSTGASCRS